MKENVRHHLCFQLARVSRRMMGLYERRCRAVGLTPIQLLVLGILQEQNATTISELAFELGFDASTMTRIIQRMVDAKLVERMVDPGDRRMQRVYLHKDVKRRLKAWMNEAQKLESEMSAYLTSSEYATLDQLLKKLDLPDEEAETVPPVTPPSKSAASKSKPVEQPSKSSRRNKA